MLLHQLHPSPDVFIPRFPYPKPGAKILFRQRERGRRKPQRHFSPLWLSPQNIFTPGSSSSDTTNLGSLKLPKPFVWSLPWQWDDLQVFAHPPDSPPVWNQETWCVLKFILLLMSSPWVIKGLTVSFLVFGFNWLLWYLTAQLSLSPSLTELWHSLSYN